MMKENNVSVQEVSRGLQFSNDNSFKYQNIFLRYIQSLCNYTVCYIVRLFLPIPLKAKLIYLLPVLSRNSVDTPFITLSILYSGASVYFLSSTLSSYKIEINHYLSLVADSKPIFINAMKETEFDKRKYSTYLYKTVVEEGLSKENTFKLIPEA